jgi:hypothetical protein
MKIIKKLLVASIALTAVTAQLAHAESKQPCVNWDASDFQPAPNARNGTIAPDYGLYWFKVGNSSQPEQVKKAYTPASLEPYFSNGKRNLAPGPNQPKLYAIIKGAYQKQLQRAGYFNSNKPTIIFIHGWSPNMTENKRRFSLCYQYKTSNTEYSKMYNTLKYFKAKGWNVGIFYWTQFADQLYIPKVESKIYPNIPFSSRSWVYLDKNNQIQTCSNTLNKHCMALPKNARGQQDSVSELAFHAYADGLPANYQQNIRIAGFSLGSQVAIQLTHQIVQNQHLPQPSRLVLLDPYFSKITPMGLGQSVSQVSAADITNIVSTMNANNHPFAISMYRTSDLSETAYDNLVKNKSDVSNMIAYQRLFPKYLEGAGLEKNELSEEQHVSAPVLYFQSMKSPPTVIENGASYVNAASSDGAVKSMAGTQRFQTVTPGSTSATDKSEHDFAHTEDDVFSAQNPAHPT